MQAQIKPTMTPEEYLRQERKAPFKSEYYAGEVFAMAGASPRHVLITTNTAASLVPQLKGRPCFVFTADLRVKVSAGRLYTYPDVVVVCGRPRYEDRPEGHAAESDCSCRGALNSTEAYRRGEKFGMYRRSEVAD